MEKIKSAEGGNDTKAKSIIKNRKNNKRRSNVPLKIIAAAIFLSSMCPIVWFHNELETLVGNLDVGNKQFYLPPESKFSRRGNKSTDTKEVLPQRRWAYAFLLSGIEANEPMRYRGSLYNIMVASYILRESGSKADVVAMIQMKKEGETLPHDDVHRLTVMNIQIHYLPALKDPTFYSIQLEKFNILDLLQYSRVLYVDSDVMPLCNLDYLFDLSEPSDESNQPPILKENVILAGYNEPCSGGFFMLRPMPGDFKAIRAIIAEREWKGIQLPWPHFDKKEGWGHVIKPPDQWRYVLNMHISPKIRKERVAASNPNLWDWYGVFVDQGLLYYWVKYFKKNVSIIIEDEIENWGSTSNSRGVNNETTAHLEYTIKNSTAAEGYNCGKLAAAPRKQRHRNSNGDFDFKGNKYQVHRDFVHFAGPTKPWLKEYFLGDMTRHPQVWFSSLNSLVIKYNLRDNITEWKGGNMKTKNMGDGKSNFHFPTHSEMKLHIIKKFNISAETLEFWEMQHKPEAN